MRRHPLEPVVGIFHKYLGSCSGPGSEPIEQTDAVGSGDSGQRITSQGGAGSLTDALGHSDSGPFQRWTVSSRVQQPEALGHTYPPAATQTVSPPLPSARPPRPQRSSAERSAVLPVDAEEKAATASASQVPSYIQEQPLNLSSPVKVSGGGGGPSADVAAAAAAINAACSFINLSQLLQQDRSAPAPGDIRQQWSGLQPEAQLIRQIELTTVLQQEVIVRLVEFAKAHAPLHNLLVEAKLWERLCQAASAVSMSGETAVQQRQPGTSQLLTNLTSDNRPVADRIAMLLELAPLLTGSSSMFSAAFSSGDLR